MILRYTLKNEKKICKTKKTQLQERTFLCYYHTYLNKKIVLEFFSDFQKHEAVQN